MRPSLYTSLQREPFLPSTFVSYQNTLNLQLACELSAEAYVHPSPQIDLITGPAPTLHQPQIQLQQPLSLPSTNPKLTLNQPRTYLTPMLPYTNPQSSLLPSLMITPPDMLKANGSSSKPKPRDQPRSDQVLRLKTRDPSGLSTLDCCEAEWWSWGGHGLP